jgi:hypothetical protein
VLYPEPKGSGKLLKPLELGEILHAFLSDDVKPLAPFYPLEKPPSTRVSKYLERRS